MTARVAVRGPGATPGRTSLRSRAEVPAGGAAAVEIGASQIAASDVDASDIDASDVDASDLDASDLDTDEIDADEIHADEVVGVSRPDEAETGETSPGGDDVTRPRLAAPAIAAESTEDLLRELAALPPRDPRHALLRDRIVEQELRLVHHLAQRFRGRGEPYDDLVQVGTIGLLNAVDRYDASRGGFTGYAVPTIVGEIRRHFRDRSWALRVPRRLQDLGRQVATARHRLTQDLGRSPTVEEIASHLRLDPDLVVEALETAGAYATVPLPTAPDEPDHRALGFHDEAIDLVEHRETLRPLLARLPARERRIVALRFGRGMSQSQIAAEVGLSQMHVSRLLARSLASMREALTEEV